MRKIILLLSTFLVSLNLNSQSLSLNELFSLCNRKNWDEVNEVLLLKGWEFHDSRKGDDNHYSTITWSFDKNSYNDRAPGWFHLYTFEDLPNKIFYTFTNKKYYNVLKSSISSAGMVLVKSSIEDNQIVAKYSNAKFYISLISEKREKENYSEDENSLTAYSVELIKKEGVYDNENGLKQSFDENGNITYEYTLRNNVIHGNAKVYYSSGQVKSNTNFLNGNKHGHSIEYDENGDIISEFNYINGEKNGLYKIFENNKIVLEGFLKNGIKSGAFKTYDDNGFIDQEYYFKNDLLDGQYIAYDYIDNKLALKTIGTYLNDAKSGLWQTFKITDKKTELLMFTNYINNEKEGAFKRVKNDSIIFGNYKADQLNGEYLVFTSLNTLFFGRIDGDTTNSPLIVKGFYSNGFKTGYWQYYAISRSIIKEGRFYEDLKVGEWRYYFDKYVSEKGATMSYSGLLYLIENYQSGKKNGKETRYGYLNSIKIMCDTSENRNVNPLDSCNSLKYEKVLNTYYFKNDDLHGPFEEKDSLGIILAKGNFVNGEKDGLWLESNVLYDDEGKSLYIFYRGLYSNGLELGVWEEFINEKNIISRRSYKNGKLNGKWIQYNLNNKPKEEKNFEDGRFSSLIVYDSLGINIIRRFDILEESNTKYKCLYINYLKEGRNTQVYTIKKGNNSPINHNFFEFDFYLKAGKTSNGKDGYPDGEHKEYDAGGNVIVEGTLYNQEKIGIWKHYYRDENVFTTQGFTNNIGGVENYFFISSGLPFSGNFLQKYPNGQVMLSFKIEKSERNGKSKYYDENGKVTKTEKYEKGTLKD
ncbi:toxin-antitoxin system YwqK family antitoxin [Aurantibacillus circumpalustris]|uniref:toxin-antitoxin system YwqK family antitoxin n=1 Tax=Aurantibacillus circumpalustris TaxID=3036359 RepID=UPI00295AF39F|nr:hypothetical protein [Aurantibacillus circumpalustris]